MSRGHDTDSLLARARDGVRNVHKTTIPNARGGEAIQIAFVLAPGDVKQMALSRSIARLDELKIPHELRMWEDLENEQAWQLLWQVMRNPDRLNEHAAKHVGELRELLTVDERDVLLQEYLDFEDRFSPDLETLTEDKAQGIREALKKKDLRGLTAFGSCSLASFMISTANPSPTSPELNSASGGSSEKEPSK